MDPKKLRANTRNFVQLLMDNAAKPRSWSIKQAADTATLWIYDVIGGLFGGVDAQQVARELAALDVSTINVRINSPGGDVFDARAIATALRQHSARVVAQVDGWAASAASTIAMAADEILIADGGFLMIHNAWTIALGNKNDMLDTAALLDNIDGAIAKDYIARTGASAEQVQAWMDAETWFAAQDAVDAGLADSVIAQPAGSQSAAGNWNLAAYRNAPHVPDQDPAPESRRPLPHRELLEKRLALFERNPA